MFELLKEFTNKKIIIAPKACYTNEQFLDTCQIVVNIILKTSSFSFTTYGSLYLKNIIFNGIDLVLTNSINEEEKIICN